MNKDIEYINKLINKMKTIKEDNNYPEDILSNNDCILLGNYITNLQEEVNKLTAESTEWESKYYEADNDRHKLFEQKEKAIEIIEQDKASASFNTAERLALNILGDSNEH